MLQGDNFNSRLTVADCLIAVEFALTDQRFDYSPYIWQVHMSDSKKGRLLAVAKARPQSEEFPSFSLNVSLTVQADKTTDIKWSFDASSNCAATTEKTNANLMDYLKELQTKPIEQPVVAPAPQKTFQSVFAPPSISTQPPINASVPAPKYTESQAAPDSSTLKGVIPEVKSSSVKQINSDYYSTQRSSPGQSSKSDDHNSSSKLATPINSEQPRATVEDQAEPLSIAGWLRHFVFGDCCPQCGGPKRSENCESEFHR